jgi:hypothetical protein
MHLRVWRFNKLNFQNMTLKVNLGQITIVEDNERYKLYSRDRMSIVDNARFPKIAYYYRPKGRRKETVRPTFECRNGSWRPSPCWYRSIRRKGRSVCILIHQMHISRVVDEYLCVFAVGCRQLGSYFPDILCMMNCLLSVPVAKWASYWLQSNLKGRSVTAVAPPVKECSTGRATPNSTLKCSITAGAGGGGGGPLLTTRKEN